MSPFIRIDVVHAAAVGFIGDWDACVLSVPRRWDACVIARELSIYIYTDSNVRFYLVYMTRVVADSATGEVRQERAYFTPARWGRHLRGGYISFTFRLRGGGVTCGVAV